MSAERAAHLTATTYPKPSIFEIIAQGSLSNTLHPALQKLLQFLASCRPQTFGWLADCSDELYLLLNGALQNYYLKKYDASFSEHFYGLKRISTSPDDKINLTNDERKISLMYLVVLPYIKLKIEQRLAVYRLEVADGILFNKWERRIKSALCSLQAITNLTWQLWSIHQMLRYMSGSTVSPTLGLHLSRLTLTYAPPTSLLRPVGVAALTSLALSSALELFAFLMQFVGAWQNEPKARLMSEMPAPPAPDYEPRAEALRGICPVCLQRWSVPTVLVVSGYVFCFRCIVQALQDKRACPVTHLPASLMHIVRLYDT